MGADCHASSGGVISVAHEARIDADWRVVIAEGPEATFESAKAGGVVGRVGGVGAGRPALPGLRIAVVERDYVGCQVERLASGHTELAIGVSVV